MHFAEGFADEKIAASLMRQLSWTHFLAPLRGLNWRGDQSNGDRHLLLQLPSRRRGRRNQYLAP
jgi:hypothetical protein